MGPARPDRRLGEPADQPLRPQLGLRHLRLLQGARAEERRLQGHGQGAAGLGVGRAGRDRGPLRHRLQRHRLQDLGRQGACRSPRPTGGAVLRRQLRGRRRAASTRSSRFLYIYVNKAPGKPLDPLVARVPEARCCSKEGQEVVVKDGYLPLTAEHRRARSSPSSSRRLGSGDARWLPPASTIRDAGWRPRRRGSRGVKRDRPRRRRGSSRSAGSAIVVCVLGILVFIVERGGAAVPRPASGGTARARSPRDPRRPATPPLALGVDEYQKYLYAVAPDGRGRVLSGWRTAARAARVPDRRLARRARSRPSSRSLLGDTSPPAPATAASRSPRSRFAPDVRERSSCADLDVDGRVDAATVAARSAAGAPIRAASPTSSTTSGERRRRPSSATTRSSSRGTTDEDDGRAAPRRVRAQAGERVTRGRASAARTRSSRGTDRGQRLPLGARRRRAAAHRRLAGRRARRSPRSSWLLGGNSFVVGTEDGARLRLVRARRAARTTRAAHGARARVRAAGRRRPSRSRRRRATAASSPSATTARVVLRHLTSERTLLALRRRRRRRALALITPQGRRRSWSRGSDGDLARFAIAQPASGGQLARRCSARSGTRATPRPSTSGSRRAPPTTSSRSSASCRSSSARSRARSTRCSSRSRSPSSARSTPRSSCTRRSARRVKPTVEIMAALPSVVIGFLAGL